jgi:hypothetical protein
MSGGPTARYRSYPWEIHIRQLDSCRRYDRLNGRSEKVDRYVGPVGSTGTGEKAVRMLLEQAMNAKAEVDLRVARYRRALERMRRF